MAIGALEMYAASATPSAGMRDEGPCSSAHDARSVAGLAGRIADQPSHAGGSGKRVAIVGAGAAGMACAHDLALLGHPCVIFDAEQEPGGLLTRGIPDFRFPTASIRSECADILALGVEFRGAMPIQGSDALGALLGDGFDAVFLAVGASAPREPLFEDGERAATIDAMALLRGGASVAGRVVVIGDGDLAVDAARVAARIGRYASGRDQVEVQLVLTTPIERSSISPAMVGAAIHDGIAIRDGWTPRRMCVEDGRVSAIEIARQDGRMSSIVQCDYLVTAAPRVAALDALGTRLTVDGAGHIAVDPDTLRTTVPGVWAGGACAFGHRSIAHAVADGKRAAWHIHAALEGVPVRAAILSAWVEADDRRPEHTQQAHTTIRRALPLRGTAPVDPFSPSALPDAESMRQEAARCYDCSIVPSVDDACTLCGTCVAECPEEAFSIDGDPRRLELDQDRCTRCGICAERCPEGAITMVRAVWEERLTTARPPVETPTMEESGCADEEPAFTPR